ncbi:MAG: hypothetical protein GYB31_14255 [Bacteroidetes bacterium]|nr:hypothetical protein [Bacteroidota bacterium]
MRSLIAVSLSILFLTACNSEAPSTDGINLNNGEKWKVNAEMKPHIEKGKQILSNYISRDHNDHKALAKLLQNQNASLIESCTMKGESHDELHKWLHPHMELINDLANAADSEEASTIISQIEQSFKTYQTYFE